MRTSRSRDRLAPRRPRSLARVGLTVLAATAAVLAPAASASASLAGVGPTDPGTGFPSFYDDGTTKLELCIRAGDPCTAGTTVAGTPSTPANITPETFYFIADADPGTIQGAPAGASVKYRASLEAAFGNGPVEVGQQITFGRVDVVGKGLTPNKTYTITHPYGTATATSNDKGILKYREEVGCPAPGPGIGACDFGIANLSAIGPYLRWDPAVAPAAPAGFIGDALTAHRVVGSPKGTNFFRLSAVGELAETPNFTVAGKLFVPPVTVTPPGGVYKSSQAVSMTTTDATARIHYTTDGTPVTATSPVYAGPITIGNPTTSSVTKLNYAAQTAAGDMGPAFSQSYTVDVVAPTVAATPAGGTYTSATQVSLSATDDMAGPTTIYYTTNGTTPTTASAKYSAPIPVSGNVTVKYIAVDAAGNASPVASQAYNVTVAGATTLTARAVTASVDFGGSASISGKLTDAGGNGIGGAAVQVQLRPAGSTAFTAVAGAAATTAVDGTVTVAGLNPAKNTDYRLAYAGNGAGATASTSPAVRVAVRPTLTLTASPTTVRAGTATTLSGAVTPAAAAAKGGSVTLTIRRTGTTAVQTAGAGVNTTTGAYSWSYKPATAGTYTITATYTSPDTTNYTGSATSSTTTVTVN